MGRHRKLDEKTHNILVRAARKGLPISHAVKLVKITERTFYRWKQRALKGESPYAELIEDIEAAASTNALAMLDVLDRAAQGGDTSSAKWLLGALHGIGGGRHQVEHTHQVVAQGEPSPLREKLVALPTEQLLELRRQIEEDHVIEAGEYDE